MTVPALDPATLRYIADRFDRIRADASVASAAQLHTRFGRELGRLRAIATRNERRRAPVVEPPPREGGIEFVAVRP